MTQVKSKGPKPIANSLQKRFLSLPEREQAGVTNFFNLHNAAHFVYDGLSEDAQAYVTYCIKLDTNANKIEKANQSANV